ncbi:MAG: Ku protein [Terriglobia bacterium]
MQTSRQRRTRRSITQNLPDIRLPARATNSNRSRSFQEINWPGNAPGYAGARSQGIELRQVHRHCRTRLRRPLFCPTCNRMVEQSEVVKGYEYEKEQYLLVEDEEIKKLAPAP